MDCIKLASKVWSPTIVYTAAVGCGCNCWEFWQYRVSVVGEAAYTYSVKNADISAVKLVYLGVLPGVSVYINFEALMLGHLKSWSCGNWIQLLRLYSSAIGLNPCQAHPVVFSLMIGVPMGCIGLASLLRVVVKL